MNHDSYRRDIWRIDTQRQGQGHLDGDVGRRAGNGNPLGRGNTVEQRQSIDLSAHADYWRRDVDRGNVVASGGCACDDRADGHGLGAQLAADLDLDVDCARIELETPRDRGSRGIYSHQVHVVVEVEARGIDSHERLGVGHLGHRGLGALDLDLLDAQGLDPQRQPGRRRAGRLLNADADRLADDRIERHADLLRLEVDDLDPGVGRDQLDSHQRVFAV